jgi:hypothetical protein
MKSLDDVKIGARVKHVNPNAEKYFGREGTIEGKSDHVNTDIGIGIKQDVAFVKFDGEDEAIFCALNEVEYV